MTTLEITGEDLPIMPVDHPQRLADLNRIRDLVIQYLFL